MASKKNKNIGLQIKKIRLEWGFTQKEFAMYLNKKSETFVDPANKIINTTAFTAQSIANWESGLHAPRYTTLRLIENAFGTESSYFLGTSDFEGTLEYGLHTKDEISRENLYRYHGMPLYVVTEKGNYWTLVNNNKGGAYNSDGILQYFNEFSKTDRFYSFNNIKDSLSIEEVRQKEKVWLIFINGPGDTTQLYNGWYYYNSQKDTLEAEDHSYLIGLQHLKRAFLAYDQEQ